MDVAYNEVTCSNPDPNTRIATIITRHTARISSVHMNDDIILTIIVRAEDTRHQGIDSLTFGGP